MVRQSLLFIVLTIALVIALAVWGVPALVKVAGFLGEIHNSSQPIEEDKDTLAPFAPQIAINYEATASARIDVAGYGEAKATVILLNNGNKVAEVLVNEDGEFKIDGIKLDEGLNEFVAQAVDAAGNESPLSRERRVVFDDQAPRITMDSPDISQENIRSDEKLFGVRGSSEIGAKVYINDRLARTGSDGKFEMQVPLNEGENEIKVRAVDTAGNDAEVSFKVSYYE